MRRAAGTVPSSCSQAVPGAGRSFEEPANLGLGGGEATHTPLLSVITAAFVTVLVGAALAFQKYRFNNGLMLGATLAAVDWYQDTTRGKGLPPSRRIVLLIATSAAALALVLQQVARVFVTGLAPAITHS